MRYVFYAFAAVGMIMAWLNLTSDGRAVMRSVHETSSNGPRVFD